MANFLDTVKIRKLENGFTVRYHVAAVENSVNELPQELKGFSRERFVATKAELVGLIEKLVIEFVAE